MLQGSKSELIKYSKVCMSTYQHVTLVFVCAHFWCLSSLCFLKDVLLQTPLFYIFYISTQLLSHQNNNKIWLSVVDSLLRWVWLFLFQYKACSICKKNIVKTSCKISRLFGYLSFFGGRFLHMIRLLTHHLQIERWEQKSFKCLVIKKRKEHFCIPSFRCSSPTCLLKLDESTENRLQ